MIKTKSKKQIKSEVEQSESNLQSNVSLDSQSEDTFVVVRDEKRVSDREYKTKNDSELLSEFEFWKKVIKKWPDGTKLKVVKYDPKKYKVW